MRGFYVSLLTASLALCLEVGKVDEFKGKVDKLQRGQVRPQGLTPGATKLSVGDILRTKSDGNAKVSFIDGNRVELGPLTRLDVLEYQEKRSVSVVRGRVLFEVTRLKPGEGFEVKTPTAILGVKGTTFLVDVTPTATLVTVFSGAVQITPINNQTVSYTAIKGETYRVAATEATKSENEEPKQTIQRIETQPLTPSIPSVNPPCVR